MTQRSRRTIDTIPVGPLGIIPLASCAEIGKKVDNYLVEWRHANTSEHKTSIIFSGYEKDSYIVNASVPRFGSGEAKAIINESVRGQDVYLIVDVCNNSLTYKMC